MSQSDVFTGKAITGYSFVVMARPVDENADPLLATAVSAVKYTISEIAADGTLTPVTGHENVTLTVGDVFQTALATDDDAWTKDSIGYGFKHVVDASTNPPTLTAGMSYQIDYEITPVAGQKIPMRGKVKTI